MPWPYPDDPNAKLRPFVFALITACCVLCMVVVLAFCMLLVCQAFEWVWGQL